MKATAPSPKTAKTNLITITVNSGGSAIKDTYQVLSVYVESAVNKIPFCEIEIADGSTAKGDFPISDTDTFIPGAEIEILAGYENSSNSIFKGIVIQHSIHTASSEGSVLRVLCMDKAVKMAVGSKQASFKDMTDSEVISKLIENHGLSANVVATTDKSDLVQYNATDWDFMVTRADVNGLVAIVKDGKVSIKNPDEETEVILGLTYGDDILDFNASIDAQTQFKTIKSSAWDIKSQAVISGEATPSNKNIGNLSTDTLSEAIGLDSFDLQTVAGLDSDRLKVWAQAQASKSANAKIRGTVKFQGSALAFPGSLIGLKGLGKRFNGNAYVSGVIHDIRRGNWISTAQLGLSPDWYAAKNETTAASAAALIPGIQGLQVGKVQKIAEDPAGEFRVLIKLPLLQSDEDGIWARLSTFYASAGSGAFFYPEIDDEVIVGFLNDDPRYPVILGSVYSSGRPAPGTPNEENNTKAFVSREKMKISFDEDKKEITILTPANNQLVFSDEDESISMIDQNSNSIKLSAEGIEIKSSSNIKISAAESVTIDGPTGITQTAEGGTIALSAMTISASADAELSLSGEAAASLSASGEVSITGAMVMINS